MSKEELVQVDEGLLKRYNSIPYLNYKETYNMSKNENFTLEDLLATIEKQASDAETEGSTADKKEDALESRKKDSGETSEAEAEKAKAEKKEGQEKSASEQGADLAKEILEKVASNNKENTKMSKQASVAGKALAYAILTKLASAGDVATENGVTAGTVPQKNIVDNALMVGQDSAKIQAVPGTDGAGNGGSVNQIFDAIVTDAMSEGATAYDQTQSSGASAGEGAAIYQGVTANGHADESQEKMAAAITLVENGFDFDSAVDLVKEAAEAIEEEEFTMAKQAAVGELIGQGFDFDTAVELVKEASKVSTVGKYVGKPLAKVNKAIQKATGVDSWAGAGNKIKGKASDAYVDAKGTLREEGADLASTLKSIATGKAAEGEYFIARGGKKGFGGHVGAHESGKISRLDALGHLARNRIAQGTAAATAVGGGTYALTREKKAAFEALVDAGVDFEKAAELVAAKSQELYGL